MGKTAHKKEQEKALKIKQAKEQEKEVFVTPNPIISAELGICNDPMIGVSKTVVGPCNKNDKNRNEDKA